MTTFHLGDVLSVTTNRLVSPDHIDGVKQIMSFMTGDGLMTHQLPRAGDVCGPALLAQHPQLAAVRTPERFDGKAGVLSWLAEQVAIFGERLEVTPLAPGAWESRNPIGEMVDIIDRNRATR